MILLDMFKAGDTTAHLDGEDDEHARRFGWYPGRSTEETVRSTFRRWQNDWQREGPTRALAARIAATGHLVGGCELRLRDHEVATMSYWIFPHYRRCGFGSQVARLASDYAFHTLRVGRVELSIEEDNVGSMGVARRAAFDEAGVRRVVREPERLLYVRMAPASLGAAEGAI